MVAIAVAVLCATAVPAGAVPAIGCGSIEVRHKHYSVRAHVLSCKLARPWASAFLAHGSVPAGYDCQRYGPRITRVRFLCFNPNTSTRTDGPQSFSATT